ncbi:MAG: cytochrome b/b6 domain-containing protein [Nitrososphaerota archaeon]|nr:cytochrome b/b6 domain-containing protein [Nitrososphaerota archaeon]
MNPIIVPQLSVLSNVESSTSGRLATDWAAAIILFFAAVFAIHFIRRAYRQPKRVGGTPVEIAGNKVKAFDIVQRAFHWSLFGILGLVMLSGVAIFAPGTFNALLQAFGAVGSTAQATQVDVALHTDMLWLLLGLVVIHLVWDIVAARSTKTIVPRKADFSDTMTRVKGFFGFGPSIQPRHGKYDAFMKLFHWGLTLCLVILGISGLYLWNPYGLLPAVTPAFESTMRLLHDIFAFLLIGLVAGHIYFAVLPVNWPVLRMVILGSVSGETYNHDFDSRRWPVKEAGAAAAPAKVAAPVVTPTVKATQVTDAAKSDRVA